MVDAVERGSQIGVQRPQALAGLSPRGHEDGLHRVLAGTARPEPIRSGLEPSLPLGLQCGRRQGLKRPVSDHRNTEPAPLSSRFRNENPLDGPGFPGSRAELKPGGHFGLFPATHDDAPVDPGRLAASVDLRHPPHAQQRVRPGAEQQFLQLRTFFRSPALLAVKIRCRSRRTSSWTCRQSIASQSTTSSSGPFATPVASNLPIGSGVFVHQAITGSPDPRQLPFGPGNRPYPTSYAQTTRRRCRSRGPGFPLPFGRRHWLLGSSCARWGIEPSSRSAYRQQPACRTPTGLSCCT
jgi:hypothetical protein